ncbi:MAG: hypothetical protein NTZ48_04240, partial [Candidatus Omnitrophica bacterium]|nr:hypothetical protein [Candidatus Omnitrophota bacterium]
MTSIKRKVSVETFPSHSESAFSACRQASARHTSLWLCRIKRYAHHQMTTLADLARAAFGPRSISRIDWLKLMAISLLVVFFGTLTTVYFFPIYPDEISARLVLSRLPYDFPYKISGAPTCLSTFCQSIPATMYVPGIINWLVHGMIGTAPTLRVVGIAIAVCWVAGLALYLIYRVEQQLLCDPGTNECARQRLYITGFCIALFCVGVFPVFLIANRSEQFMLPSLAVLIGLFIISRRLKNSVRTWQKAGMMVMYFVSVSLVLYWHAK